MYEAIETTSQSARVKPVDFTVPPIGHRVVVIGHFEWWSTSNICGLTFMVSDMLMLPTPPTSFKWTYGLAPKEIIVLREPDKEETLGNYDQGRGMELRECEDDEDGIFEDFVVD